MSVTFSSLHNVNISSWRYIQCRSRVDPTKIHILWMWCELHLHYIVYYFAAFRRLVPVLQSSLQNHHQVQCFTYGICPSCLTTNSSCCCVIALPSDRIKFTSSMEEHFYLCVYFWCSVSCQCFWTKLYKWFMYCVYPCVIFILLCSCLFWNMVEIF